MLFAAARVFNGDVCDESFAAEEPAAARVQGEGGEEGGGFEGVEEVLGGCGGEAGFRGFVVFEDDGGGGGGDCFCFGGEEAAGCVVWFLLFGFFWGWGGAGGGEEAGVVGVVGVGAARRFVGVELGGEGAGGTL